MEWRIHIISWLVQWLEYYVDVEVVAALHVAAAFFRQDQRIFAHGGPFSWDAILDNMRELDPKRKIAENFSGGQRN